MKLICFILGLFYTLTTFGQRGDDPCSKQIYTFTDNPTKEEMALFSPFNPSQDTFVSRYVKMHFPEALEYITFSKTGLIPIKNTLKFNHQLEFATADTTGVGGTISLRIITEKNELNLLSDSVEYFVFSEDFIFVTAINGKEFWGVIDNISDTTKIITIERISSIQFSLNGLDYSVNTKLYSDLINPNLFYHFKSFRSIEAYFAPSVNAYYIYISGDTPRKSTNEDSLFQSDSYLCKLIIQSDGSCKRIVMPGQYLRYFGWIWCEDFWMF